MSESWGLGSNRTYLIHRQIPSDEAGGARGVWRVGGGRTLRRSISITQEGKRFGTHSRCVVGLGLGARGGRGERESGGTFGEPEVGEILGGSFPGATRGGHRGFRVNHGRLSGSRLDTILNASISSGHSPALPRVAFVLHAGYDAVPSVSIHWDPARAWWSRKGCGDWPAASLQVQSDCDDGNRACPRRVVRSRRRRWWCFRRTAL